MPNSDSSLAVVGLVEESSWGTTPSSALTLLRITGESLGQQVSTTQSNEINQTRSISDVIRTAVQANGGVNTELSYGNTDALMEGALGSDWAAPLSVSASTISAAQSDNSLNGSATTEFTNVVVGQWVKVAGFTTPGNNGFAKVVSKTNAKIVLSGLTLTDEAEGDAVTVTSGGYLRNGTTKKSYTLEKSFTDVTQFIAFTGMRVDTMELSVGTGNVLTANFTFMGKEGAIAQATVGSGAATPAPTNPVLNAIDNVADFTYGGTSQPFDMTAFTMQVQNNLRSQPAIGSVTPIGVGVGTCTVSGTMNVYFADEDVYEDFVNYATTSLSFRLVDTSGNACIVTMPSFKVTSAQVNAEGLNRDVMAAVSFSAFQSATAGCTIQVDRFPA